MFLGQSGDRIDAYILSDSQATEGAIGYCRLNYYLKKIGLIQDDICRFCFWDLRACVMTLAVAKLLLFRTLFVAPQEVRLIHLNDTLRFASTSGLSFGKWRVTRDLRPQQQASFVDKFPFCFNSKLEKNKINHLKNRSQVK